jgi:hypothetical protein
MCQHIIYLKVLVLLMLVTLYGLKSVNLGIFNGTPGLFNFNPGPPSFSIVNKHKGHRFWNLISEFDITMDIATYYNF